MEKYGKKQREATCIAPESVGVIAPSEESVWKGSQLEIAIDQHEEMLHHLAQQGTRSRS
jgi:hypothetical protein